MDDLFKLREPGWRAFAKLETDLEYFERTVGPPAAIAALNKMRKTIEVRVARKVWEESKTAHVVDSKRNRLVAGKVKTPLKLNHVRRRIFTSKATRNRPMSRITGYITPIPLISLTSRQKGGGAVLKGQQTKSKGATPKRGARTGGIKVGGSHFPGAFLQVAHKKQQIHVWMRKTPKTWKPGKYGWGRPPGTTQGDRAAYDVAKLDLEPSFRRHFEKTVSTVIKERAQIEFDRALEASQARLLKGGKY